MRVQPLRSLLTVFLLPACVHFSSVEEIPPSFRDRLARHEEWLTVSAFDNDKGRFPPSELLGSKRWRLVRQGREDDWKLVEVMMSSFVGLMERIREGPESTVILPLSGPIDLVDLLPVRQGASGFARSRWERDTYSFKSIDQDRFELIINEGHGRIAFMPAPPRCERNHPPVPVVRDRLGIWHAPFGPESEIFSYITTLFAKADSSIAAKKVQQMSGDFLHHDLNRRIPVHVEASFSSRFRGTLAEVLAEWNSALGTPLFVLANESPQTLAKSDCVTGYSLCIRWHGSQDIPFTGMSGFTEIAFDPVTGVIVGGLITFINEDRPVRNLPAEDATRVRTGQIDRDWLARSMLNYAIMSQVRHPMPEKYLQYLLLHEICHFNGLAHDFHVDLTTKIGDPPLTIMGYPPFAIAHQAHQLGQSDRARIAQIYQRNHREKLAYCSTLEAMAPELSGGLTPRVEQCDLFVLGDEADWYLALARAGQAGVFTTYPDGSSLQTELREMYRQMREARGLPPQNILTKLTQILKGKSITGEVGRQKIKAYLCAQRRELPMIRTQLFRYAKMMLDCSWIKMAASS